MGDSTYARRRSRCVRYQTGRHHPPTATLHMVEALERLFGNTEKWTVQRVTVQCCQPSRACPAQHPSHAGSTRGSGRAAGQALRVHGRRGGSTPGRPKKANALCFWKAPARCFWSLECL